MIKKNYISDERVNIDHFKAAILLITAIQKCPMDKWCKKVLLLKVGRPWEGKMPKSNLQIAILFGCLEDEINEIEEAGKNILFDFMDRASDMAFSKDFENKVVNQAVVSYKVNPDNQAA